MGMEQMMELELQGASKKNRRAKKFRQGSGGDFGTLPHFG
jgi:hypothetical protein